MIMNLENKSHVSVFLCTSLYMYEIARDIKKAMWTIELCAEGVYEPAGIYRIVDDALPVKAVQ